MEPKDYAKLLSKAKEMGYEGRGSLSSFLQFLAQNQIIFVDDNIKTLLTHSILPFLLKTIW